MNKVVEELKKVKIFYIATVEGDQPELDHFPVLLNLKEMHIYVQENRKKYTLKFLKIQKLNYQECMMEELG